MGTDPTTTESTLARLRELVKERDALRAQVQRWKNTDALALSDCTKAYSKERTRARAAEAREQKLREALTAIAAGDPARWMRTAADVAAEALKDAGASGDGREGGAR